MFDEKPVQNSKSSSYGDSQNHILRAQELIGDKSVENDLRNSEYLKIPPAPHAPCASNVQCTTSIGVLKLSDCIIKTREIGFINSSSPYSPMITPAEAFPTEAFEDESPRSQREHGTNSLFQQSYPHPSIVSNFARQILNDLNNTSEEEEKDNFGFSSYRVLSGSMECSSSDSDS